MNSRVLHLSTINHNLHKSGYVVNDKIDLFMKCSSTYFWWSDKASRFGEINVSISELKHTDKWRMCRTILIDLYCYFTIKDSYQDAFYFTTQSLNLTRHSNVLCYIISFYLFAFNILKSLNGEFCFKQNEVCEFDNFENFDNLEIWCHDFFLRFFFFFFVENILNLTLVLW